MTTHQLAGLDGGYTLAPMCEQYLNMETLGTQEDAESLIKRVTALFGTDEYSGWSNPSDPEEYARIFVDGLDPVTLNIVNASWRSGLFPNHVIAKIRAQRYSAEETRNYALLMIAINDLQQKAGATRQFDGLHKLLADASGNPITRLDLSTDEAIRSSIALLRYSVTVTGEMGWWSARKFFLTAEHDEIIVDPTMHALLTQYPHKADLFASMVVESGEQNVGLFRQMMIPDVVSGRITEPLIDGAL